MSRGRTVLFRAAGVDVRYDPKQLLFGGARRYGLSRIVLTRPQLDLERHADGSFDLGAAAPAGGVPAGKGPSVRGAPWKFSLAVRDGSVTLGDPFRTLAVARELSAGGLELTAEIDTGGLSLYRGSGRVAGDPRQAFSFAGRAEADGYALHRIRAPLLEIAPIADYFINTPSAAIVRGTARNLDLTAYSFPSTPAAPDYHLAGSTFVQGAAMHVPGLALDATEMRGRLDAFDGGLAARRLDARLGGLAVRLSGALFNWGAPTFRLAAVSRGDLSQIRALFRFSRRLPLAGGASLGTLLEGPVGAPLVATRVEAGRVAYGRFPAEGLSGRAIYYANAVDVVAARARYGGLEVGANGSIALGDGAPSSELALTAGGPAAGLPYVAQVAPRATLEAAAVVQGLGLRLDARGIASGSGGGVTLASAFHVDPSGDGAFGPASAARSDGSSLAGTLYLDRARNRSGFWLDARGYPVADLGTRPQLPGIALVAPPFAGRLDGRVAGAGPPSAFRLAGRIRARELRVANVAIDDVSGDVAGAFGNLRLGRVVARGPWGAFHGGGGYAAGRLALAGAYAGTFERLRTFTGDLGGSGSVTGPVALLIDPRRTVVQARGDGSATAVVHGVPVDSIAGTLDIAGKRVRVDAATARVAGGDLAAAGSPGSPAGLGVSLGGADAGRMAPFGGVHSGRVAAIGVVGRGSGAAGFSGGLALADSRIDGLPFSGNGDVALRPDRFGFGSTDVVVDGEFGELGGSIAGLGSREPVYDVGAHLASVRLARLARIFDPARRDVAGTLAADLRARGTFATLGVSGTVALPEGRVAGLAFSEAFAKVSLDRAGIRAGDGHVRVGSTLADFAASYRGDDTAIRLSAPRADLSDFNDLFDAGDTLGGHGRVALRFRAHGKTTFTSADIAIGGLKYRSFDLGDARARWESRGPSVRGSVGFGGASGRLAATGVLALPAGARRDEILRRSRFEGSADLEGLDLGVWLPALGYHVPVEGRLDATATVTGALRDPAIAATATLRNGSVANFPVDSFTLAVSSTLDRTTVRQLELDLPSVSVAGSGTFGLADSAPLALRLHATSPNLGALSTRLFGAALPATGAADLDVSVAGTRAKPRIAGTLEVRSASLRGVIVPEAHAGFTVRDRDLVLSDARAAFAAGALELDGSLPVQLSPLAVGPPRAALGLSFVARDLELSNFIPLLPAGSQLRGRVDGSVTLGGTAGAPHLAGRMTLAGGFVESPLETVPLTDLTAELGFAGSSVTLGSLHASAGGGALDASGSVRVADLVHPGADAAYDFVARADKLRLDLPAYGAGVVDGTLGLERAAGGIPSLAGDVRLSEATIPFSALLSAGGGVAGRGGFDALAPATGRAGGAALGARNVALNLDVSAERNVRVRSANVDIGGRGNLHVGGTVVAPQLAGGFTSTGGTITYFNTVFRLVDGTVAFVPELGLIPTLDARAVTHVIDPDPNTVRNVAGTADVTLSLAGPITNLTIGLVSDPPYEREQILGLLLGAPALGASNLFGESRDQARLYGSSATPGASAGLPVYRSATGELSVAQEAFGVANAQFTRTLLAPIETTFAQAVGLSNFNLNVDYTGNVGVSARKVLGKKVNAVYGSTFGYPYRQTFGFELHPNVVTAAQVTVFETLGANGLNSLTPTSFITTTNNPKLGATQPTSGTAGFSLSLQRLF